MKKDNLLLFCTIFSFVTGALFIVANRNWVMYGLLLILFGILELILSNHKTFLKVIAMLHIVLAIFSFFGMLSIGSLVVVFAAYLFLSIVFSIKGFKQ